MPCFWIRSRVHADHREGRDRQHGDVERVETVEGPDRDFVAPRSTRSSHSPITGTALTESVPTAVAKKASSFQGSR